MTFCFLSMSPPKMISSPRPCTTVWRLVSGGPVTAAGDPPLPYTRQATAPALLARDTSSTYICMGLQLSDWYRGLPTFRLWGGWWPSCRRAIGGMECPSVGACGGLEEEAGGGGLAEAPPVAEGEEEEDGKGAEEEDARALTASRPRRRAAGETAPGGVRAEAVEGGVWRPLVLRASGMDEDREEEEEGGGGGESHP